MRQWAVPFGQSVGASHCLADVGADPPDVEFSFPNNHGSQLAFWGEITGTYAGPLEAEYLWDEAPRNSGLVYSGPDDSIAANTALIVLKKLSKYQDLVQKRGLGHLLVVLNSPLTTSTTRVKAEEQTLPLLEEAFQNKNNPFESVWFAYRLGHTSPQDIVEEQYVFPVIGEPNRWNFFKCLWYTKS